MGHRQPSPCGLGDCDECDADAPHTAETCPGRCVVHDAHGYQAGPGCGLEGDLCPTHAKEATNA
jgi:hypothetical protein